MSRINNFIHSAVATGAGSGYLPAAPGTWGSALAVLIYYFFLASFPLWLFAATILGTYALGVISAEHFDRQHGTTDSGRIVIDEFVGQWIALFAVPAVPLVIISAFLLFRLFDILKPWPIKLIEQKLGGGQAVMLDDVAAGVLAGLVLHGTILLWAVF